MELSKPSPGAGRREWIGLAVIALPCLFYAMDLTVLNLALPRLTAALSPTSTQMLWIVDIYGFLVAGFLITMGNLGDRIGRRRLLMIGAAAFGAASVLAAFADSARTLIVARAILGVAGATLAPSTLSLIRNLFPDPRERTLAIGIWTTSFSVGGAIGPVLGGVLLEHFAWGSVFLMGVPVMVLLLAVGPVLLPESRDETARPLDLMSALLSLAAVLVAIASMKEWVEHGMGTRPVAMAAASVVVGAIFLNRQRLLPEPLVDLSLFRRAAFNVSLGTFTLTAAVVFGSYVFIGQYLQLVAGLSPLRAGLYLLPSATGVILGSMLAPAIVRRFPAPRVMGVALLLVTMGFVLLSRVGTFGLPAVVAGAGLTYVGLGPVFTLGTDVIIGAAPPERAGAAAALSETSSELGGALGIAVLGSIGTAIYRSSMSAMTLPGVPGAARSAAMDTLGAAVAAADTLPAPLSVLLRGAAQSAFTDALQTTATICAAIAAITALLAVAMFRAGPDEAPVNEGVQIANTSPAE
jgi:DHA2 family multidrug resistance protein-like MFS transporter